MTNSNNTTIKKGAQRTAPAICILLSTLALIYDTELKSAIINGMNLAALRIVPTLFPFMILSDYWIKNVVIDRRNILGICLEKAFKINRSAATPFLCGIFAGFPLGVRSAVALYEANGITADELNRLAPIINLPSLAFVISGIGLGLYNDIKIGLMLYFCVLLSSIAVGIIKGSNKSNSTYSANISRQTFSLTDSIKQAGLSSIAISSYIIFFSCVIGIIASLIKNQVLCAVISSLFEVGGSTLIISQRLAFNKNAALILTSFALGFSGLSVHLQAFSFLPRKIKLKGYISSKLAIGFLSAIFTLIILTIYN